MTGRTLVVLTLFLKFTIGKERLTVILERESITYLDHKYIKIHDHGLIRANRTAPYGYNINATILQPWYNNVTVEIKGFENRNNEYRESILHFKYLVCDLCEKPNFLMKIAKSFGNIPTKCPFVNNIYVQNFSVREDQIPAFFPKARWMMQFQVYTTKTKVKLIELEVYFQITSVMVKNNKKTKKTR